MVVLLVLGWVLAQMGSVSDNTSGGTYAYRASKAAENISVPQRNSVHVTNLLAEPKFRLVPFGF